MKNFTKTNLLYILIFIILCGLSALVHFLYEWSGIAILSIISPISESIWEHTKVIITPFIIVSIIIFLFFRRNARDFFSTVSKSIVIMTIFMISFFYTYSGIIGRSVVIIDILLAFLCELIGLFFIHQYLQKKQQTSIFWFIPGVMLIIAIIVFTFIQPNIPLFVE